MSKVHKGRAIKVVEATACPIEPIRAEHADLSDTEFAEFHAMWEMEFAQWKETQNGTSHKGGQTDDSANGPGATGWKNPDSYTGPSFK